VAEAEVHFCHWRNTGDETSARRVRELIRETPSTRYLFNGLEGSSQDAHVTYGSPG